MESTPPRKRSVTSTGADPPTLAFDFIELTAPRSEPQSPTTFGLGAPEPKWHSERLLRPDSPLPSNYLILTSQRNQEEHIEKIQSEYSGQTLTATRDDLESPPLEKIIQRRRADTATSFRSVDFDPGPPEVVPDIEVEDMDPKAKPTLKMKTVDFEVDPTFHRSLSSPYLPVEEAIVERVGSFDITNLRRDSLGNLPKLSQSPTVEALSSGIPSPGSSPTSDVAPDAFIPPKISARRSQHPPSVPYPSPADEDGTVDQAAGVVSQDQAASPAFPPLTLSIEDPPLERKPTHSSTSILPPGPRETTAITFTDVVPEHVEFIPLPQAEVDDPGTPHFRDVLSQSEEVRARNSVAASIKSVQNILSKDWSTHTSPSSSRRSSTWSTTLGGLKERLAGHGMERMEEEGVAFLDEASGSESSRVV